MAKQTIEQALHLARSRKSKSLTHAASLLDGVEIANDAARITARNEVEGHLPHRTDRAYTLQQWVNAAYDTRGDRYRSLLWQ